MSPDIEPVIQVANLYRTYHAGDVDVLALRGVDFAAYPGDFIAIMGSSGSGKSTLMSILGCLDRPTGGTYYFEGRNVGGLSEPELAAIRSQKLGFVFQSFNLLARTSALENVELPLIYAPEAVTADERQAKARESLRLLGLAEREQNTPGQLSGGQQQRVAIARALINDPSVLLADEPTGNLDTRTAHDIMDVLVALNRSRGLTIILVTHEADIAAYADRVVTMRDGRIVSDVQNREPYAARSAQTGRQKSGGHDGMVGTTAFGSMILSAALQAILRNKMRSALTTLGVFIGVAALIAMVAIGQGANDVVRKQIESLGTNLLVVLPGARTGGGARGGFGSASTLTVEDARAVMREDASVGQVSYIIRQGGQVQVGDQNWATSIQGVTANYAPITNWSIAFGRGITDVDVDNAAQVAVVGQTVWRQLFGAYANPLGALLTVKNTPFRIVGVFAAKGQSSNGSDQDDVVMIPFTTAERKVLGVAVPSQQVQNNSIYGSLSNPYGIVPKLTGYVNQIYVQALRPDLVGETLDEVTRTLARRHHVKRGDQNDFSVRNLSQIASAAEGSSKTMSNLLAAVASISLLVGGIGIMNTLMVSVTERTREVGLRMAIGARRRQVLLQFLAEAVLLSVVGGAAGILGGIATSAAISYFAGWATPMSWAAIGGGFLFSALVGIFFGFYPARKAASLNPIEALRFE